MVLTKLESRSGFRDSDQMFVDPMCCIELYRTLINGYLWIFMVLRSGGTYLPVQDNSFRGFPVTVIILLYILVLKLLQFRLFDECFIAINIIIWISGSYADFSLEFQIVFSLWIWYLFFISRFWPKKVSQQMIIDHIWEQFLCFFLMKLREHGLKYYILL